MAQPEETTVDSVKKLATEAHTRIDALTLRVEEFAQKVGLVTAAAPATPEPGKTE